MKRLIIAFLLLLLASPAYADWTVIRQITQGSTNADSFTTSAFDGDGGNTIFYFLAGYDGGSETVTITDSHNNYIACLADLIDGDGRLARLCYARDATTSASMTVTVTDGGANVYPCISVLVVSNASGMLSALDKQDTGTSAGASVNALAVGAVVPDTNGEFIVSGLAWGGTIGGLVAIDAPFTLSGDNVGQEDLDIGNHFGCALAYYEQASAASVNPNFTWAGAAVPVNAITATFRDAHIAPCSGTSPTLTAATWADVQTCHTKAVDDATEDVITVTSGSSSYDAATVFTKYVKVVCGGTCTITDNSADASNFLTITESIYGHTRVEGFHFVAGTGNHVNPNGVILVTYATNGLSVLLKNVHYDNTSAATGDFIIWNSPYRGVIWDSSMTSGVNGGCSNTSAFVRIGNEGLTSVWTEGPYYGAADTNGDKNLYIEDNTITNTLHGVDVFANARTVIRHNHVINSTIENHGSESGIGISGRSIDLYSNIFERSNTVLSCGFSFAMDKVIWLRGGPALIHDNVIPAFTSVDWTVIELTFTDLKLRRNAGPWACWTAGYPSPYQVGWGFSTGVTQAGASGVFMDLEPVYLWGNTGAGNYGSPDVSDKEAECGGMAPSVADYIQVNRDYYLNTEKPGYTAYIYPHPLQGEGASVPSVGTRTRIRMR